MDGLSSSGEPGEMVLYAYRAEQELGGFASVSANADNGKVIVSKAARITGRVIDTSGKSQARHRVIVEVATGRSIYVGPVSDHGHL